jgi:MFS family permease
VVIIVSLSYLMVYFHRVAPAVVSDLFMAEFNLSGAVLGFACLGRILIGFGVSVIFVSMLKIVTEWFPQKQFGTLSGTALFIGNSGAVLAATPLAYLVSLWGWRVSFSLVGGVGILAVGLVIGCPTIGFISDRIGKRKLPLLTFTVMYALELGRAAGMAGREAGTFCSSVSSLSDC